MGMNTNLKGDNFFKIFDNKMENKKVPELRAEAKRLGSKRSSLLRKQDIIELISNILDHPVPEIDASLRSPTRYVLVRPRVEINQQRKREIKEIQYKIKNPVSSQEEVERERKINEIKETNRESIQLKIRRTASAFKGFARQFRIEGIASLDRENLCKEQSLKF